MDWLSTVPLWFWVLQGLLYVLAAVGWFWLCGEDRRENDGVSLVYAAIWPLTAIVAIAWLTLKAHTRRVNRRKAGWKG